MSAPAKQTGTGRLTSDLVLVHRVFRRELRALPALVSAVPAADRARATVLAAHCRELITALLNHHQAEAELLWRPLEDREPIAPPLRQQLLDWHRQHTELTGELEALLPLWLSDPEPELQAVLVDIMTELSMAADRHLDAVEECVLPAVDRHFSIGEWRMLGLRAARWIPLHRMAWMLGAMLEDASTDERNNLLAKVPAPARLLYRAVGRAQYEREIAALRTYGGTSCD